MLSKEVFKKEIQDLAVCFPNWNIDLGDKRVLQVWYSMFNNQEDEDFKTMVNRYKKSEKFNPTIAGLLYHKVDKPFRPESVEITEEDYY